MEGLFDAAKQCLLCSVKSCLGNPVYEECEKLTRYASKLSFILGEIQLCSVRDEGLRGVCNGSVFTGNTPPGHLAWHLVAASAFGCL